MMHRKLAAAYGLSVLAFITILGIGLCQDVTFDRDQAMATIREISADQLRGRQTGLKGGNAAEEWMATKIEEFGLEPGGTEGYFQPFPLMTSQEKTAKITLLDGPLGKVSFLYGDDFTLVTHSGSATLTAEAVIVGHGISKSEKGWDDYGENDVRDKVVVIFRGKPPVEVDWDEENSRNYTVNEAYLRGARAVLYFQDERPIQGGAIQQKSYHADLPSFYVRDRVVDLLLLDTGWKEETYRTQLEKQPYVLYTGKRLAITAKVKTDTAAVGRNVMGWIRGSDPEFSSEVIVVGAHLDHVGTNGRGIVYNGADDNASGSALILELARCLKNIAPPKRSILFQWYGGEEQGLLGSEYWVDNPTIEIDKVVGMLNFDMVGQGNGKVGAGGGEFYPELWDEFTMSLDSSLRANLKEHRSGQWGSDQTPFLKKDIPAFPFYTDGKHPFYHVLDDDLQWIQPEVIEAAGKTSQIWLATLANWSQPLKDGLSKERMIWTHNYQIRNRRIGVEGFDSICADFSKDRVMPIPFQWIWYQPSDSKPGMGDICKWADYWRISAKDVEKMGWALNQVEAKKMADDLKTAVMLGINDEDVLPDAQALRILRNLGVGMIRMTDPRLWMVNGSDSVKSEILSEIRDGKWWIIVPPSEDKGLIKLVDEFKSSCILWGNPESYSLIDSSTFDSLSAWCGLVVMTWEPPANTELVKELLLKFPAEKTHINLELDRDSPYYQDRASILREIKAFGDLPDSTWSWEKVLGGNLVK